jgi:alkanesulfonate monooxygenase SsuD/methylene tetrahydromethanopterin reductase-like flavin-dependent oxidoreductase (luciferase family)
MLALTGRKADGWLPSAEYFQWADRRTASRMIDDAAVEAGRDPREIRRLLNLMRTGTGLLQGGPDEWVERLLPLVLEEGFSTFLIGGDDPRTYAKLGIRHFVLSDTPYLQETALVGDALIGRLRDGQEADTGIRATASNR